MSRQSITSRDEKAPASTNEVEPAGARNTPLHRFQRLTSAASNTDAYRIERCKNTIAGRVHALLQLRRLSRSEFARRLGKTPPYVTKLLSGGENLTIESLVKIGEVLNCDLDLDLKPRESKHLCVTIRITSVCLSERGDRFDSFVDADEDDGDEAQRILSPDAWLERSTVFVAYPCRQGLQRCDATLAQPVATEKCHRQQEHWEPNFMCGSA